MAAQLGDVAYQRDVADPRGGVICDIPQHTPAMFDRVGGTLERKEKKNYSHFTVIKGAIHENCTHFLELGALEWFCEDVGPHLVGWAVF